MLWSNLHLCNPFALSGYFQPVTSSTMLPFVASVNYRSVSLHRLYDNCVNVHDIMTNENGINEVFKLQTCNRNEICGMISSSSNVIKRLEAIFPHHQIFCGQNAIKHLINVVSGMDALYPSDNHVKSQCLKCYYKTYTYRTNVRFIPRMWNTILQHSKTVRRNRAHTDSLVDWVLQNIHTDRVIVVGAGSFAKSCVFFAKSKFEIVIVNKTPKKICGIETKSLNQLDELMNDDTTIVHCADFTLSTQLKKNHSPCVIDVTIPPTTTDISNSIRLADSKQKITDTENDLTTISNKILNEIYFRPEIAAEANIFNKKIDQCKDPVIRKSLLKTRHSRLLQLKKRYGLL